MNKLKLIGLLSFIFILVITACRKDENLTTTSTTTHVPVILEGFQPEVENVTARLIGFVVDENQTPITDALIKLENLTTTTDAFGHFFFENETMNAKGTYVTVEKAGYFLGSRKFYPINASKNKIKVQLIERNFNQSFEATTGGVITSEGMVTVTFGANTIANADGSLYTGLVYAATAYLNPTENKTAEEMPGDLSALNLSNEIGVLNTYGMVNVELQDANGNALNIAENETATIEMNVPGTLQANAPSTIPLWSFNDTHGIWVEEGSATLGASKYTGTVSHFTWWNCDPFANSIYIDLTLQAEGLPLPFVQTQLILASQLSFTGFATTDSSGFVTGLVPTNEVIILNVLDYCGNVIYTQNIGPFTAATSLGTIQILSNTAVQTITVTGELLDCNGYQVQNGVVTLEIDGITVYDYLDTNPFSIQVSTCNTTTQIDVKGINMDDLVESTTATYNVAPIVNAGQINVCGYVLTDFISYDVDNIGGSIILNAFASILDSTNNASTTIYANDVIGTGGYYDDLFAQINIPDTVVGSYYGNATMFIYDSSLFGSYQTQTTTDLDTLNITQFGPVGTQIIGNYSGSFTYYDTYGVPQVEPISGSFSANRSF